MTTEWGFEENSKILKWRFKVYYALHKRRFWKKSHILLDFSRTGKDINNLL